MIIKNGKKTKRGKVGLTVGHWKVKVRKGTIGKVWKGACRGGGAVVRLEEDRVG